MTTTRCYHVHTARGEVFGVAAEGKRTALAMCSERLNRESHDDHAVRADYVGMWPAPYGTVLWY